MKIPFLLLGLILFTSSTQNYLDFQTQIQGSAFFNGGFISNGDFRSNNCPGVSNWCIFKAQHTVHGWTPLPQIQVGWGSYYNDYLPKIRVLQLSGQNKCFRQDVKNLQPGDYKLQIVYTVRRHRSFQDSQFQVYFDNQHLRSIKPKCYNLQTQVIDISFRGNWDSPLQLCSTGYNNQYGAIIKSVSMFRARDYKPQPQLQPCQQTRPQPPPQIKPKPQPQHLGFFNGGFISNGDFRSHQCSGCFDRCVFKEQHTVHGWIPEPKIQIGFGNQYSDYLPKIRVIQLSGQNKCFRQDVKNLQPGDYKLQIVYTAIRQRSFQDSQFQVYFNNKHLRSIKPKCYNLQTQLIDITVTSNWDTPLKLCSTGYNNQYGAIIKSVSMFRARDYKPQPQPQTCPQPQPQPKPQAPFNGGIIVNGDFSSSSCPADRNWCYFTDRNSVPGWIPDPQIEIGYGSQYSDISFIQRARVLELAGDYNGCVRQEFRNLQSGVYRLQFVYAARKQRSFQDCQFQVSFNNQHLRSIKPNSYDLQTQVVEITVPNNCDSQLKFCSTGDNNSFGAFLRSVSMFRVRDHQPQPQFQPQPQPQPQLQPSINLPGLYLNSHSNQCFQRQYQLQGGQHQITFDYKVLSSWPVKQSFIVANFNGQVVHRVYPCDDGKNIKIIVRALQGLNTLTFCPSGSSIERQHQIVLSNIDFYRKQCQNNLLCTLFKWLKC